MYDGTATSRAPERNGGNKGPYKMVLNNPEVEKWWQSQDRVDAIVPQLANDNQTEMEAAGTLRDPWDYDVNGTLGPAEFATLTVFKSEPFDFYVSAKDDDDCAQLRVVNTGLPSSEAVSVDGFPVSATQSIFEDPELFSYYPEFPQGLMVRRNFQWKAPIESSYARPKFDTRPEISFVCFYAHDSYLLTNKPLYCIELIIVEKPPEIEELNECFCRTCAEDGKYVATRELRPIMNYAPRVEAYKAQVDNLYNDEVDDKIHYIPASDYVNGVNGEGTPTSDAGNPMGDKKRKL